MEGDTGITAAADATPTNHLLSPPPPQPSSWRLNIDHFRLPETSNTNSSDRFSGFRRLFRRNPSKYILFHILISHITHRMITTMLQHASDFTIKYI